MLTPEERALLLLIRWYMSAEGCSYAWRNEWEDCPKSGGWNTRVEGDAKGPWCEFCETRKLLQELGRLPERHPNDPTPPRPAHLNWRKHDKKPKRSG